MISSDLFSNTGVYKKQTALSRILDKHDYRYSIDEAFFQKNKNEKARMFPNLPSNFSLNRHGSDSSLKRRNNKPHTTESSTTSEAYEPTLKTLRIPISNEYDTYMLPDSFCLKNYKAFVYEYLEADGKN